MTSRDFVYWLQGFLEISTAGKSNSKLELIPAQVKCIQSHLNLVFKHEIDPSFSISEEYQAELQAIHDDYKNKPDLHEQYQEKIDELNKMWAEKFVQNQMKYPPFFNNNSNEKARC